MECHRCPHREDVEAGKYRRVPFEKTPCASCQLVERSEHTIAFDEGRPAKQDAPAEEFWLPEDPEPEETHLPVSVMSEALAALLSLRPTTRDVVCWRYVGMKYREIALIEGITMAAVELRHRRALRKWPELHALFEEKLAKQKRRKPHRRSYGETRIDRRGTSARGAGYSRLDS